MREPEYWYSWVLAMCSAISEKSRESVVVVSPELGIWPTLPRTAVIREEAESPEPAISRGIPTTERESSVDGRVSFRKALQCHQACTLTLSLEDEVNLAGVVLAADAVLGGRVEVELLKSIVGTVKVDGAGGIGLDTVAKVLELGTRRSVVGGEVDGAAAGGRCSAGVDVDGRLVGAGGAERVVVTQAVPVERTLELIVAKLTICTAGKVGVTRVKSGAVVAPGRSQGGEGEDSNRLHVEGLVCG